MTIYRNKSYILFIFLIIIILILIILLTFYYHNQNKLRFESYKNFVKFKSNSNFKFYKNINDAIYDIKNGSIIAIGGFNMNGVPNDLITALSKKKVFDLTCISIQKGEIHYGTNLLLHSGQIKKLITPFIGQNKYFTELLLSGKIEVEIIPIGNLSEKMRAGGSGIPAFYTPIGCDTVIEYGEFPSKYNKNGKIIEKSIKKESRYFNNKKYILEESIICDFAFIKAWKGDRYGNLIFNGTEQNFNSECAKSGKICIAEVEEFVEDYDLNPNEIDLPGIFVHRIIQSSNIDKNKNSLYYKHNLEQLKDVINFNSNMPFQISKIAQRAAKEISKGMYVNLGIGIPLKILHFLHKDLLVNIHNENGILGFGDYQSPSKFNPSIVNVGNEAINYINGSSTFSLSDSFTMIRGGYIDLAILGALEVSSSGDISNWMIPNKKFIGIGGSMDLLVGAKKIIITMQHCNKDGEPKIVEKCKYPITAKGVVDLIITELAIFKINKSNNNKELILTECSKNSSIKEIQEKTEAKFKISKNLKYF
jgi:3-oxoacid CoA-transferase